MALPNPSPLTIDSDDLVAFQLNLDYRQRKALASELARHVNAYTVHAGIAAPSSAQGESLARALEEIGYVRLGPLLDRTAVNDVLRHFAAQPCFDAHVYAKSDGEPRTVEELAAAADFGCYRPEDVVTSPHLLELANDPRILRAVESYLGCVPSLYSMNAWWSFPRAGHPVSLTREFHRDGDDLKNCVLFMYLTDVGADGCHEYIRYSHQPAEMARRLGGKDRFVVDIPDGAGMRRVSVRFEDLFTGEGYGGDAVYRALFADLVDAIEGQAGEAFLTDPDGLHRARQPESRRRLIVWLRYGLHRNRAYIQDKLWPVPRARVAGRLPDTPESRFINRLVVEPD
jgi:hypothetical protein